MSGLSKAESAKNGLLARKLLGVKYEVRLPEEWQSEITQQTIFSRDILELSNCKIVIVDYKNTGELVKGKIVIGRGVWEEAGYAKAIKKIVIEINPSNDFHPFAYGATKVVASLEECVKYIKEEVI